MSNIDYKSILYSKEMSPLEFNFETLIAPSIYNWFNQYDIDSLYNIASSIKYSAHIDKKKKAIDDIMRMRGCRKIGGGTNRVVYAPYECKVNCFKIALDSVGMNDNPAEYQNQNLIKPFVTKMFEHDMSGVIGNSERVKPIQSVTEYESVAEDIFELLTNKILGKYVLEDIGTKYMFNYGVRVGFGVVLLDYPMVFEIDGSKIFCNNQLPDGMCGGEIDYDDGFNHLYCTKCGKHYQARKLATEIKNHRIKIQKEDADMSLISQLKINGVVVSQSDGSTDTIPEREVLGTIRTRKVRMTDKEIRKMENEQRRKQNEERKKQQEQKEESVSYIKETPSNTIADNISEKEKDIVFGGKLKTEETESVKGKDKEVFDDLEKVPLVSAKEIMGAIGAKEDEEVDYSKYGLESIKNEEENNSEEETKTKYEEEYPEEHDNFQPIKNKLSKKLENY